jgi:hypothetical protein
VECVAQNDFSLGDATASLFGLDEDSTLGFINDAVLGNGVTAIGELATDPSLSGAVKAVISNPSSIDLVNGTMAAVGRIPTGHMVSTATQVSFNNLNTVLLPPTASLTATAVRNTSPLYRSILKGAGRANLTKLAFDAVGFLWGAYICQDQ